MARQRSIGAPPIAATSVGVPQVLAATVVFGAAIVVGFALGMARPRRTLTTGPGFGSRSAMPPETGTGGE